LPPELDRFLKATGITIEEFEAASEKSPAPYLGGVTQIFNKFRKIVRRQAG
jgi:hypothetical protein